MKACDSCGRVNTCPVTLFVVDCPDIYRTQQTKYVYESLDLCKECLANLIKDCKECAEAYRIWSKRYEVEHG